MFGIGGGELVFIVLIVLMLFGSDKIPDMARTLGKGMRQLKDATNDIKSEIHKGAEANGLDSSLLDIRGNIKAEIEKAKDNMLGDTPQELDKTRTEIEDIASGPIKRQN
ncbi:MAG TPA: twin-arginine translocase TatA/TatE family subunit [Flavobacterium sp.]|jgi:sec-independent protein translocase protein TatA